MFVWIWQTILEQLRSTSLPLVIETGRHKGISREQRICQQCLLNAIDNKTRFIYILYVRTYIVLIPVKCCKLMHRTVKLEEMLMCFTLRWFIQSLFYRSDVQKRSTAVASRSQTRSKRSAVYVGEGTSNHRFYSGI